MSTSGEPRPTESRDFSLVLGGPLYQLLRRSRLTGDTLELLHRRVIVLTAAGLGAVASVVACGGHSLAWARHAAVPARRGHARPSTAGAAAAHPGRTGREHATGPHGAGVRGSRDGPGCGPAGIRRSHRLGHAPAQFDRRGGAAHRVRLRRRGWVHMAEADGARRGHLVRRAGQWNTAAVACRVVAGPREPADCPVPPAALVFPAVDLGALPVAGVAPRVDARADASGPERRPGISRAWWATHSRRCCWRRGPCLPG